MNEPIAVLCADIHLSHNPPIARSDEPDWYEAMARSLRRVRELSDEMNVPVLCAGDVFHKWNSPPELINFAIKELPKMCAVPGQHDLPQHRLDDIRRSAYWTLVEADVIQNIDNERVCGSKGFRVIGFPWGIDLHSVNQTSDDVVWVALIHKFAWTKLSDGYVGAPVTDKVREHRRKLNGFDVAVFGDNHISFESGEDPFVFNCGCLIPRNINEMDQPSSVGILMSDGMVKREFIGSSEDVWVDTRKENSEVAPARLVEFLDELGALENDSLDFREALERFMREEGRVSDGAKRVLLDVLGE